MYSFPNFAQCQFDSYKASMPTRPRTPARLAPIIVLEAAPEEEDGTAAALEEVEAPDVLVLVDDLVVVEVELG